jgi:membrane protease YdiL (CAAX protease family)
MNSAARTQHTLTGAGQPWTGFLGVALVVLTLLALGLASNNLARACILLMIAPLTEEIIFRAGLQETLLMRRVTRHVSNLATALVFALAHVALQRDWAGLAVVLPALLIGEVYGRQRRLAPCILLHAGMNAVWLLWAHAG